MPLRARRLLLRLLANHFLPTVPIVLGLDAIHERRRGKRIRAKGIFRDLVRSSHSHFVNTSGLRCLSHALDAGGLRPGVCGRVHSCALAPFERYCHERGIRHNRLTDCARHLLLLQAHLRLDDISPGRTLITVADSNFAVLELLAALTDRMTCTTAIQT
ncbi:MAG: hypothetical protein ACR2M1_05190 [Gemmatimonadaceae bacterium]